MFCIRTRIPSGKKDRSQGCFINNLFDKCSRGVFSGKGCSWDYRIQRWIKHNPSFQGLLSDKGVRHVNELPYKVRSNAALWAGCSRKCGLSGKVMPCCQAWIPSERSHAEIEITSKMFVCVCVHMSMAKKHLSNSKSKHDAQTWQYYSNWSFSSSWLEIYLCNSDLLKLLSWLFKTSRK